MKKHIIETLLGILGALCFVCLCCEPAEGTSTASWIIWELSWMAGLVIDVKLFELAERKGWIEADEDGTV